MFIFVKNSTCLRIAISAYCFIIFRSTPGVLFCLVIKKLILGQKNEFCFWKLAEWNFFLSLTRSHSQMCIRIYIFDFQKHQTNKQKKKESKKTKKNQQKNRRITGNISGKPILKKNLRPPGEDFCSHPHFRKCVIFFRS